MRVTVFLICIVAGVSSSFGAARIEQWLNIPGSEVTDTLSQGLLDRSPDATRAWESFEAVSSKESDAIVVTGIVRAPQDGQYRFLIAADDTALLFVSTDARPESRQQVALVPAFGGRCDWTRYAAQRSAPVTLRKGQRCLVQAVAKNGSGPGHVEVGWELPDGKLEGPIPESRIETPSDLIRPPRYGSVPAAITIRPDVRPATSSGMHKFIKAADVRVGEKELEVSYLLFLPAGYEDSRDSVPLFIFLHGNGHQGLDLEGILNEGPAQYLNTVPGLKEWMPMAMLFPQLPHNWRWDTPGAAEMTNALVREICRHYPRFDRERIYLSGLSMGGKGTWLVALDAPELYAAIAPISSVAVKPGVAAQRLSGLNTWIICGELDHLFTQGSKEMYQAMSPLGGRVKLTVVAKGGHGCWAKFYPERSFYEELMSHRRGQ